MLALTTGPITLRPGKIASHTTQTDQFQATCGPRDKTRAIDSDQDRETHLAIDQGAMTGTLQSTSLATTSPRTCATPTTVQLEFLQGGREGSRSEAPAMDSLIAGSRQIVLDKQPTSLPGKAPALGYTQTYNRDSTSPRTTPQQRDNRMAQQPGSLREPPPTALGQITNQHGRPATRESRVGTGSQRSIIGRNLSKMRTVAFLTDFMAAAKKGTHQKTDHKTQSHNVSQCLLSQDKCQDNSQIAEHKTPKSPSNNHSLQT